MSEAMLATRKLLTSLERRIFMGFAEGRVRPTLALAVARLDRERQRELGDRFEQNGRLLKRDVDGVRYRHHTVAPALEDPSPDTLHREPGIGRVVDFRPRPTADTPRPGTRDSPSTGDRAALATVLAEDARDNLGGSSMPVGPAPALGRDVREYGIPGYIDSGPVQLHSPEPDRSDPPVTAALSSTPANPDTAREQQKPGISHDLRLALRTIAHEAEKQGLDEDAWIEAACEAWRAGPGRQPHL